jgi:hypothetical protein
MPIGKNKIFSRDCLVPRNDEFPLRMQQLKHRYWDCLKNLSRKIVIPTIIQAYYFITRFIQKGTEYFENKVIRFKEVDGLFILLRLKTNGKANALYSGIRYSLFVIRYSS